MDPVTVVLACLNHAAFFAGIPIRLELGGQVARRAGDRIEETKVTHVSLMDRQAEAAARADVSRLEADARQVAAAGGVPVVLLGPLGTPPRVVDERTLAPDPPAEEVRREVGDADELLAVLALRSGGEVRVDPAEYLALPPRSRLEMATWREPDGTFVLRVRERARQEDPLARAAPLYPNPVDGRCAKCHGDLETRHCDGAAYQRCKGCGTIHEDARPPRAGGAS